LNILCSFWSIGFLVRFFSSPVRFSVLITLVTMQLQKLQKNHCALIITMLNGSFLNSEVSATMINFMPFKFKRDHDVEISHLKVMEYMIINASSQWAEDF